MAAIQRVSAAGVTVGAVTTLFGTVLAWIQSGAQRRSSYELVDLVGRLGFADGGWVEQALRLWPLVPLLVVVTTVANWWPRSSATAQLVRVSSAVVCAVWSGVVAIVIARVDESSLISVGPGPLVTLSGAATMLIAAAFGEVSASRRGR